MKKIAPILPYMKLVGQFPLHFSAAYISALICTSLLAVQPSLLKVFINEYNRGVSKEHLTSITLFMIAGLVLVFIFDTIEVSIGVVLRLKIENYLRKVHFYATRGETGPSVDMAIRRGIFGLTSFSLQVTLELLLVFSNFIIISLFLFYEAPHLAPIIFICALLGIYGSFFYGNSLGRIARYREIVKGRMIIQKDNEDFFEESIQKLQKFEKRRFFIDTFLVFIRFSIFKVFPVIILFYFSFRNIDSIGSIASIFLYFGLLAQPYMRLTTLIKILNLSFKQTDLFRSDIEVGIIFDQLSQNFPFGLVSLKTSKKGGTKLSCLEGISLSSIFYDDGMEGQQLEETLGKLKERSKKELIIILSSREEILAKGHFLCDLENTNPYPNLAESLAS
jgi:hypothetical protein